MWQRTRHDSLDGTTSFSSPKKFLEQHSLVAGVALMFALTWPIYSQLGLFVGYGLALAALIVTLLTMGSVGVRTLLRRFLMWRVGLRWYRIVLCVPLLMNLATVGIHALWRGALPDFNGVEAHHIFGEATGLWRYVIPFFVVDALTNGEEMAWRGYVLPRLQACHSARVSSVILGLLWGVWHWPRFWHFGEGGAFAFCLLHNVAAAFLYTWVFNGTGGSLLLTTLFHAVFNTAYVFLPVNAGPDDWDLFMIRLLVEFAAVGAVFRAIKQPASQPAQSPVCSR